MPAERLRRPRIPTNAGDIRVSASRTSPIGACHYCAEPIYLAYNSDEATMSVAHSYPQCDAWQSSGMLTIGRSPQPNVEGGRPGPALLAQRFKL